MKPCHMQQRASRRYYFKWSKSEKEKHHMTLHGEPKNKTNEQS